MSQFARANPEEAGRAARRADLAMEQYRYQEAYEAAFKEALSEEEREPIVAAAQEVFAEMDNDCREALREV